ncbi:MAG TPA: sugar phosphate isomerase/epimerase [Candidatus Brocadiia bacterium]|nr:sugar phosphate isomerase/epimerase [Candidatus Brocadiia bacterium]
MARIPVALQLYSVRDDCAKDLPGVLKAVAKMGYAGVEFAGYHGFSAKQLKKLLADNKLKVAGTHLGLDSLLGEELQKTVDFNKTIGNKYLIVPGLAEERRNSRKAWQITAEIFNGISGKLVKIGMRTGYHNHSIEFTPMDGELPWDTFFGLTDEKVVMQFDTGNAMHGGADAVPFLKRYPGRATTVHLKEFSRTNDKALIGEGDVDWKKIFKLCEGPSRTKWYIVEQESYACPPMECVAKCLENIRKMGR